MSTTIDERVLEMRFDNRQFESNVSSTMSTLDKLKQKLNFTGASKGLENVNAAAKGVNMTGLGSAVETVTAKFSALQVMGVTALANITNSAVNAGKRIVSALTIDPIRSGMQEYETKMGSIQTILANTQHQGTTMDDVTAALQELNLYADKTIYNFQEMTRNIGTFTAAGVDLDTSVKSIQGIANLAAISGSTSQQASTAMYQLSQALATGTVKLMDWNSVVNAGMGGKVFQNALIQTAAMLDGASDDVAAWQKENIDAHGSFRDSLTEGAWLTSEVLTQTLKQFTMAAEEGTEEWEAYKKSLMETGYTEAQAIGILKMANTATDAATKVKTFTQLFDTLKESAQSGWAQTWELIFGDFEEAKEFFTGLSTMLGGLIESMSEYRNSILGGALDSNWDRLISKLNEAGHKTGEYEEAIRDVWVEHGKTSEELDTVIAKYGSLENAIKKGAISTDILKEALARLGIGTSSSSEKFADFVAQIEKIDRILGFGSVGDDVKSLQTALEALGHSVGECKIDGIIGPDTTAAIKEFQKEAGIAVDGIAGPETLAALKEAGKSFDEVTGKTDKTVESYHELVDNITDKGGRELFLEGFSNIVNGLVGTFRALGSAWAEIFPASDAQSGLFTALETFNKMTASLRIFETVTNENGESIVKFTEKGEKLVRIFKGVFAIIDVITTLIGGGFKIAFKVASQFLSYFNLDILDFIAGFADAAVGFRDFIDGILNIGGVIEKIAPHIKAAADAVKAWFESLKTSENLPADIVAGLVNGLIGGAGMVWDAAIALAKSVVDAVKSFLGIHSPSVVMAELGENTVEGYKNGIESGFNALIGVIETIVSSIVNAFKKIWIFLTSDREGLDWEATFGTGVLSSIAKGLVAVIDTVTSTLKSFWNFITGEDGTLDWGKLMSAGMLFSMVWFLKQIATAISGISEAFGGLGDVFENAARVLKSFSKVLNGYAWELKANAMLKMAGAIGILVLALVVLTEIDDIGKLWNAVGIIAALAVILGVLAFAMDRLNSVSVDFDGKKIEGLKSGLLQIGLVILLLAAAVKIVGEMDPEQAKQGFLGLAAMAAGMIVFLAVISGLTKHTKNLTQVGGMMLKLSVAMGLMIMVLKMIDGLNGDEVFGGIIFATAFAIFVRSILSVAKSSGNNVSKVGGMMIKLAIAMGLMIGVVKLAGSLSLGEMAKGTLFAAGFVVFLRTLVSATKIGKKQQIAKLGGLVLSVSFSLTLLVGVCKLVGMLRYNEMAKGAIFMGGFIILLKLLVSALSIGSEQQMARVSGTILAMATAVAILAAVAVALSFVDLGGLAKGVTAVAILGLIVSTMAKSLKGANNVMGSLIVMTTAIAVMAGAIVALTFIDDTSKLMAASAALGIVMGMFALIAKCSGGINKAAITLGVMTIAVGALATILWLLSNNIKDADSAIKVATSLGILMAAMAVSLKMVAGFQSISLSAIGGMAGMVIILAGLVGVFALLKMFDIEPSIEAATSLSVLLLAMAGVTAICATFGAAAGFAIAGAVALAAVIAIIGVVIAAIGALNQKFPQIETFLDSGISVLQQIGEGIGRFVGGLIGGIGEGAMDSLLDMTETFGEVVDKIAEISDKGVNVESGSLDGVLDLVKVLAAIGAVTVGTTISDIFTLGGTSMEKFQTDAAAFFDAMKVVGEASTGVTIDTENLTAIVKAGEKLADLQSSIEPIGGLASYLMGHTDLATFGTSVAAFIESMKVALDSLWGYQFDAQTFDGVIDAAKKLAELQSSLESIGGVVSWFKGRDDLGTFGANVASFIESMKIALDSLWGYQFDTQTLDEIVAACTSLATLQSSLEPIGGVISWFNGRDDLATFGTNVAAFMGSMKTAMESLWGVQIDTQAIDSVIAAAKKLASFQSELEPMGGVIEWFSGRTDLGTFGTNVGLFADAMGKLKSGMGENGITEEVITSITNAGTAILELNKALPTETWFDGKMNLSEFSGYVTEFASAMASFGTTAAGIDSTAVNTAMVTANRIKNLIESLVDLDTSGLQTFTGIGTGGFGADGAAYEVAQAMAKFSDKVSDIDTSKVTTAATAANKIKNLISDLVGLDTSGIDTFKSAVTELAEIDMSSIAKNFSGASTDLSKVGSDIINGLAKGMKGAVTSVKATLSGVLLSLNESIVSKVSIFEKAGSQMMSRFAHGLSSKSSTAKAAVMSCVSSSATIIRAYYISFYSAGSFLVDGFAAGISANTFKAAAKAAAMANAAEAAARAALAINSPSKVFREIGMGIPEGFVQGIDMLSGSVDDSLYEMADRAISSVGNTISKLAALVESDIDSQPTIRPVLDLSDVRSGAASIGSLFDTTSQVGVMANVGTVSTMMRGYGQNGGNSDIVSTIDKLRKDLGNISGDTYTVGNVTYDDGSNIADAVKTITRVARMERRI